MILLLYNNSNKINVTSFSPLHRYTTIYIWGLSVIVLQIIFKMGGWYVTSINTVFLIVNDTTYVKPLSYSSGVIWKLLCLGTYPNDSQTLSR